MMKKNRSEKIRVLIVDDSLLFQELLTIGLGTDRTIEVVARAVDPFEARDKLIEYRPDVMLCDVNMPKMNGIEFIRRLLPQYPIPVIVVTTISAAVIDALNAGAVDFATKPDLRSSTSLEVFIKDIVKKVKIAAHSQVNIRKEVPGRLRQGVEKIKRNGLIAIGASTGGTEALFSIIKSLPKMMPGIVVVQHIPPVFSGMLAKRLNEETVHEVKEAEHGDYVETGQILIAPGGKHMKIKKTGDRYRVLLFEGEKVNGHLPSIDVLFESVAEQAGKDAIGVILTGMGYDGAKGLLTIRRRGGRTIGQDEATSVVYGMPKIAYNIGAVEKQAPLGQIPRVLLDYIQEK